MNYGTLEAQIDANIIPNNDEQLITGAVLNQQLKDMVASLGAGYQYMGVATPEMEPGTPDQRVFYIAAKPGTYTNFGGIVVSEGEVAILKWDSSWHKVVTGMATAAQLNQLGQKVSGLPEVTINGADYEAQGGLISSGVFLNTGPYGSNNSFKLIPGTDYRGRKLAIVPASASHGATVAFLTSDVLVNNQTPPFCDGTSTYGPYWTSTELTIPNDCVYIYVYNTHGADVQFPSSLKVKAVASLFYTKVESDTLLAQKQGVLTFDDAPVEKSNNPVKSGGLYPIAEDVAEIKSKLYIFRWVAQDTTEGPYKPTNQNSGNNGARLDAGNIFAASSANALVTDKIEIDHTKRYKFKTQIGKYFDGVAYYEENTFLGYDVFHTTGSDETVEEELTIPSNATHFRLASKDISTAYEISIYEEYVPQFATKEEFDVVEEQTEQNTEDIQYLYGVVEQGDVPPENAIKVIPTKDLYLGGNILNVNDATFDATYWTVENGTVKYLGGGSSSTPFAFNAATTEGARYLAELTTYQPDGIYTNLFNIEIGDGPLVDTYDGTQNTRGGVVSDGGSFKIIPLSTRAFEMSSVKLSPCLPGTSSPGYERTVTLNLENVSAGNSAQTLIDGKWNVAIGSITTTMANNVSGSRSIAIGRNALHAFKFGLQNVAIGTYAAQLMEEGRYNIVIGSDAMWQTKKAEANIVIGRSALGKTGLYATMLRNIAIGHMSMSEQQEITEDAIAIGYDSNKYGIKRSVVIGNNAGTTSANKGISNVICIGYLARATESNSCVLGNSAVTTFVLGNKKLVFNNDNTVSWIAIE